MNVIPLEAIAAQQFSVLLGNQECTVSVYQRNRYMYLDLDVADVAVCRGAICQHGVSLVAPANTKFKGSLHFFNTLGAGQRPDFSGFGSRYLLLYCGEGETLPESLSR